MNSSLKTNKARIVSLTCLLFAFGVSLFGQNNSDFKYSLRVNFDGTYTYTPRYTELLPYSTGLDFGWVMNQNLTLYTGIAYWQADHSEFWHATYDYYWESPMVSILFNASGKFTTPTIKLENNDRLGAYIEPGVSVEAIPMAVINYEKIDPYSYYAEPIWDIKTRFATPYFSWNLKIGLTYIWEKYAFFDLGYTMTNMDMYKIYRGMTIEGKQLDDFCPREKILRGLRFTLGLYFK
jgi:hypothetical protein